MQESIRWIELGRESGRGLRYGFDRRQQWFLKLMN
jgi:hypothetical protein